MKDFLRQYSGKVERLNLKGTIEGLKIPQSFSRFPAQIMRLCFQPQMKAHLNLLNSSKTAKKSKQKTYYSLLEIMKATFPPASVTGAPKRKAVEIIDCLEPHSRGYYCRAAGLVKNETDFTLSVLIRTAVGIGKSLSYYAGCGIVWDSIPEKELEELYLKVKAFYPNEIKNLIK